MFFMSPVIEIPLIILLIAAIALVCIKKTRLIGRILLTLYSVFAIPAFSFVAILITAFGGSVDDKYLFIMAAVGFLLLIFVVLLIWGLMRKKALIITFVSLALILSATTVSMRVYDNYMASIPVMQESENLISEYSPVSDDSKVATLDGESTLKLESDLPVLDGATALYPVYSAFAKAVYPQSALEDYATVDCSTTSGAYERIVSGEVDMIFVSSPSEAQKQNALSHGVELEFTPIGSEGFVFFVNSKNPIENITVEQIQDIYSGKLTEWSQLGVDGLGEIKAFQRDEGSGSQTRLQKLMEGKDLMTPPTSDIAVGMGEIIKQAADYKNHKNAIGFSFRFYSTEMVKNDQIKLLSINGVAPDIKNIENGSYPLSGNFYVVTRKDKTENTGKLLEWILSEQAQLLIEKTGYTPIYPKQ